MLYLASYDIDDTKLRQKLAGCLLAYGMERLQYSVFVGTLDETIQPQLLTEINQILTKATTANHRFILMPLAEGYARKSTWIGSGPPDWSYHCNQTLTLIV